MMTHRLPSDKITKRRISENYIIYSYSKTHTVQRLIFLDLKSLRGLTVFLFLKWGWIKMNIGTFQTLFRKSKTFEF